MDGIEAAKAFSESKLHDLRATLAEIVPANELVVTCGSYARREASAASDMDFYTVLQDSSPEQDASWATDLGAAVERIVGKAIIYLTSPPSVGITGRTEGKRSHVRQHHRPHLPQRRSRSGTLRAQPLGRRAFMSALRLAPRCAAQGQDADRLFPLQRLPRQIHCPHWLDHGAQPRSPA